MSRRLIFEPEENKNASGNTGIEPSQEAETLKSIFSNQDLLMNSLCATNGTTFVLGSHGKMYFFDLSTGRRYTEVISIPDTKGGYNPFTNEFWFYVGENDDLVLRSFTIDGLNLNADTSPYKFSSLSTQRDSKERVKKMLETQDSAAKSMISQTTESFIRQLCNKNKGKAKVLKNVHNQGIHESMYVIMYSL